MSLEFGRFHRAHRRGSNSELSNYDDATFGWTPMTEDYMAIARIEKCDSDGDDYDEDDNDREQDLEFVTL